MSSREDRPTDWRTRSQSSSTSGGHVAPEADPTTSLFDALDAPLPSEIERQRGAERSEALPWSSDASGTEVIAPRRSAPEERRGKARPAKRRGRAAPRRVKRTIKHIDPLSVLKLSLVYYTCFLIIWLLGVAVLFSMLESFGLFEAIEKAGRGLVLWDSVDITLGLDERWAFLIGITLVVVGSLVNLFL
ncbi:MAG TPA: DUF3566 domain-containing protein, partial [Actinomycetota bacterium]|nr:DUF3566 domain-containing protein [Actinomycetota bacterium]